ncbi:MAG: nucleotidyl transferase AbiEii/AbiGii toxin family protein [Bacillales bacterium]|jgi:predicted nucleotidyltransferase component of viral defense system|nr:nucleotidyl transferase AbiEii/AbiGii toxin family protein [Bacillales bacterium]
MRLHLTKNLNSFKTLITELSEQYNIANFILEKDYYVTLILKELALKQENGLPAYFKGGTALYKTIKSVRRFSEDIDLTVCVDNLGNNQKKVQLENSVKKYTCLSYKGSPINLKGNITSEYIYKSLFLETITVFNSLEIIKVEATSFTISEPVIELKISPMIYDLASLETKKILEDNFDIKPFFLKTISLSRIFIDKVFATEFFFARAQKNETLYLDVSKHLYDLTILLEQKEIIDTITNINKLNKIISLTRKEEALRMGSTLTNKPIKDFSYLNKVLTNKKFQVAFKNMQIIYVFNQKEYLTIKDISKTIEQLKTIFI